MMPTVSNKKMSERQYARKMKILDVAGELFERHGYEKTTLEMIGQEVGLSKQSLYYYVASKESALLAICHLQSEELSSQRMRRLLDEGEQPDQILADYIQHMITFYLNEPRAGLLARHLHSMSKTVQEKVRQDLTQERRILQQVIALGQTRGQFGNMAPKVAARMLQSAVHGVPTWFGGAASRRAVDIVAEYQSMLLGGLRTPAEVHETFDI